MAWSRDPRTPTRYMRGSKRYNDVGGHSPPGDELENTRDHERIWFELKRSRSCCQCEDPGFKYCFQTFDWPQYICDGEFPGGDTLWGYWAGVVVENGVTTGVANTCGGLPTLANTGTIEHTAHDSGSWRNGPFAEMAGAGLQMQSAGVNWANFFPAANRTFEAWIKPTASALASGAQIISQGQVGEPLSHGGLAVYIRSNGAVGLQHIEIAGGAMQESGAGWWEADQWHHFVLVRNADTGTIAIFLNGRLALSRVLPATGWDVIEFPSTPQFDLLGQNWSDIAYYTSALSPTTIRKHYQSVYGVEGVANPLASEGATIEDPTTVITESIQIDIIDGGGEGQVGSIAVSQGDYTAFVTPEDSPFELEERKGAADGYAGLDAGAHVETDQLGTGTADADSFLRGDQTWQEGQLLPLPETLYDFISVGPDASDDYVALEASLTMHKYAFQEASAPFSASPASNFGTFSASGVAPSKSSDRPRSFFDEEYLVFDDTDGLVSSGVFAAFDWVHSFWIRLDEIPASSKTVVRHNTQTYLKVKNDGRLELSGYSGSVVITSTDPLVVGEWTHVVIGSETGFSAISWLIINGTIQTGSNVSSTGDFTVYLGGDGIQMGLARFAAQYFEIDDVPASIWTAMANSRGLRWQPFPESALPGSGGGSAGLDASENDTPVTAAPRARVNFIEGANVSLTVADDSANDEIDVTIAATSPAGSGIEVSDNDVDVSASPRGRINFLDGTGTTVVTADDGANDEVEVQVDVDNPLPDPSAETDGKVLTVATGAAVWDDAPLGVPDPSGEVDGQVLTVVGGDRVWADPPAGGGGGGGGAAFRGARVVLGADKALASSSLVALQWDGFDSYDTDGYHDPASNNTRITIPTGLGGKYAIVANVTFAASGTGTTREILLRINGATYVAAVAQPPMGASIVPVALAHQIELAEGDYVEVICYQDSAGSLNAIVGGYNSFSVQYLEGGGGGGDTAFSPLDLPFLCCWWDASDAATITASGGAVSQWNDKSGNDYHLTQATGSRQPTTGTRTINGLNVLDFDGSADCLQKTSGLSRECPYAFYAVVEIDSVAAGDRIIAQAGLTGSADWAFYFNANDLQFWNNSSPISLNDQIVAGTPALAAIRYAGVGAGQHLRCSGVKSGVGNSGIAGFDRISIGSNNTPASFWDGKVAEIIWCAGPLSAADDLAVRTYLADKWGVTP